jgi:hypothetical protein
MQCREVSTGGNFVSASAEGFTELPEPGFLVSSHSGGGAVPVPLAPAPMAIEEPSAVAP